MEEATQVIMASGKIENFIREEAARYSLTVLEFTEGQSLAVYTDGYDASNDISLMSLYTAAVDACEKWLRLVVIAELLEQQKKANAFVSLQLPNRKLNLEASTNNSRVDVFEAQSNVDKMYTPIGEMSVFAYLAITQIKNNPVMLLYNFFGDSIEQIHNILAMPIYEEQGGDGPLDEYRMEDLGIQDPLGLYRFDYLWSGVRHFFEEAKVV